MTDLRADLPRDFTRIVSRRAQQGSRGALPVGQGPAQRPAGGARQSGLRRAGAILGGGACGRGPAGGGAPAIAVAARGDRRDGSGVGRRRLVRAAAQAHGGACSGRERPWTPTRLTSSGSIASMWRCHPTAVTLRTPIVGAGGQQLLLRQVATNSVVELRPRERVNFNGVTFSPDGEFLYYSCYPFGDNMATLYRMPSIGGTRSPGRERRYSGGVLARRKPDRVRRQPPGGKTIDDRGGSKRRQRAPDRGRAETPGAVHSRPAVCLVTRWHDDRRGGDGSESRAGRGAGRRRQRRGSPWPEPGTGQR